MTTRRDRGAAIAALATMLALSTAQAQRLHVGLAPKPHENAMVDDRFAHLRMPEAYASARGRDRGGKSSHKPSLPKSKRKPASAGFFMRRT